MKNEERTRRILYGWRKHGEARGTLSVFRSIDSKASSIIKLLIGGIYER